jgi:hypothetical protein
LFLVHDRMVCRVSTALLCTDYQFSAGKRVRQGISQSMFFVLLFRSLQTILFGSESGAVLTVAGLFLLLFFDKTQTGQEDSRHWSRKESSNKWKEVLPCR